MKAILNQLFEHRKLDKSQARTVLTNISKEHYNQAQVAAFISVYLMRGITVEELEGFRDALLELCIPVSLDGRDSIDVCGTGGDGKNTFNISTLTAFVVAGAGYNVVKHGNYGVSSVCGSSNVLEHLGFEFSNDRNKLLKQLDRSNICFLHAPLFHPALKSVGPIRRQLGVKTFFNMLGPMVNPAFPNHQMVGVFSLKLARLYQYIYQRGDKKFVIVHSIDGYDEVSLTSAAKIINNGQERLVNPGYFNKPTLKDHQIFGGGTVKEAADIFKAVLKGNSTQAQRDVVVANAGLAIQCFDRNKSIESCIAEAEESILSGRANEALQKLLKTN